MKKLELNVNGLWKLKQPLNRRVCMCVYSRLLYRNLLHLTIGVIFNFLLLIVTYEQNGTLNDDNNDCLAGSLIVYLIQQVVY